MIGLECTRNIGSIATQVKFGKIMKRGKINFSVYPSHRPVVPKVYRAVLKVCRENIYFFTKIISDTIIVGIVHGLRRMLLYIVCAELYKTNKQVEIQTLITLKHFEIGQLRNTSTPFPPSKLYAKLNYLCDFMINSERHNSSLQPSLLFNFLLRFCSYVNLS